MLIDSQHPLLLALDTSTDCAAMALTNGATFAELNWPAGRSQTTSLLTAIDWFLTTNGVSVTDVSAVAVATGPGTFTGLRVGLSLAKGFVLAGDLPLIGIPTLEIAAFPCRSLGISVLVLVPAGRGRVVWAISEEGKALSAPTNSTVPELIDVLATMPHVRVTGELLPEHRVELAAVHDKIDPPALGVRRPAVLAQLAWDRWQAGSVDDAALIEPMYVHGQRVTTPPKTDRIVRKPTVKA